MSDLVRLSFSIGSDLYASLEGLVKKHGYENRSEFIRDMLREKIIETERAKNQKLIGTITIVYDHEQRELGRKLTKIQHQHHHEVVAAIHIHLDETMCAEAIIVKGEAAKIEDILHQLRREKGVVHASLAVGPLSGKHL